MSRIHANNFRTTLNGAIDNSTTSVIIASATGFPAVGGGTTCSITVQEGSTVEIMKATAISGTTLTVVRGQEGTSASSFSDTSKVEIRFTRDSVDTKQDGLSALSITTTTAATDDKILVQDTSNSDALRTVTTQAVADLKTSIVGITGTKAEFDTAVSDGNILYVGDITQYTDELAQDAIGSMIDSSLNYVDGTPLLQRAALTGDVTASAGSNSTTIATPASATVATDDKVIIKDTSASDATKYVTTQSVANLATPTSVISGASISTATVASDDKLIIQDTSDSNNVKTIEANSIITAFGSGAGTFNSFTPVIEGITSAGTGTYTTQRGTYYKINNICFIEIYLVWTGHTGTGNMKITGLPFAGRTGFTEQVVPVQKALNWVNAAAYTYISIAAGATEGLLKSQSGTSTEGVCGMDTAATWVITGHYFTD